MNRFASRATCWQLPRTCLQFSDLPMLMGIVNVTPDSFSDGGQFLQTDRAVQHALALVEQGAQVLDIGGESTRPYSTPVKVEEELTRVMPVVQEICRQTDVPVSIDTSKAPVARAAIDAGAQIINDVTGLEADPAMLPLAVKSQVGVCAMHMQGTPQTMQDDPRYQDVVRDIHEYLRMRRDALLQGGIAVASICLDPGIGFGKTQQHNLALLGAAQQFLDLQCPILIGHSRKGFIRKFAEAAGSDPVAGSIGVALALACQGIQLLRVHDVLAVRQALLLFQASGGMADCPPNGF